MKIDQNRKVILDLLKSKATLKQNIATDTTLIFKLFNDCVDKEIEALQLHIKDPRVRLFTKEKGQYEKHAFVGSDVLVFHAHNNVFRLPDDNPLWGTHYFKEDDDRGFFGVIYIYNFLAQSFLQNRGQDQGYLIGRIMFNKDRHFMIEGKGQLGVLFRDVENMELNEESIRLVIQMAFVYAIEFDMLIPPFDFVSEMTVEEVQMITINSEMQTGKRLGFKMKSDDKEII